MNTPLHRTAGQEAGEARRGFIRALHRELLGRDVDEAALDQKMRELAHLSAEDVFGVFAGSDEYRQLRARAVKLFVPPGHFYSPVTDPAELQREAGRIFGGAAMPAGVDLRPAAQLAHAERLAAHYPALPFAAGPQPGLRYHYDNPAFSYGDAIGLAGMLLILRPANVIEVGSGYSSAVTLDIVRGELRDSARCLFIDPYPERLESLLLPGDRAAIEIIRAPVQEVGLEVYDRLGDGDILFIDSTHVVKTGSDVVHHLTRVLPRLRPGVLVHFHDIFHPFEYPPQWAVEENRAWNEIYALHAFLYGNDTFEVVFFNDFFARTQREFLARRMPLFLDNPGGSLWLRKRR